MNNKTNQRNKGNNLQAFDMQFGKVPPQSTNAEIAVLGAILLEKSAIDEVSNVLVAECFYKEAHQEIYKAILQLVAKGSPLDMLTVIEQLTANEKLEEIGGPYYVKQLTDSVVSSANILSHALIIKEKHISRETIKVCSQAIVNAYDGSYDPFELVDELEEGISQIGIKHISGEMITMQTVMMRTIKKMEEWEKMDGVITGVPSGFPDLDKATRGWQPGELIILAARPSIGKSALGLALARNAAKAKVPVSFWSMEMGVEPIGLRLVASESETVMYKMQTGKLSNEEKKNMMQKGVNVLGNEKIFLSEKPSVTLNQLRSQARRYKRKHNIGLMIIDYLQLMTSGGDRENSGNREQEISKISRELKKLSLELEIPIIALSQLSREVEKRNNQKPQLSDLRESGSIEQDADVVIFIWAPTDTEKAEDRNLLNRRYIRIAKQRSGVLMTYDADFNAGIQKFESIREQSSMSAYVPGNFKQVIIDKGQPVMSLEKITEPSEDDLPF